MADKDLRALVKQLWHKVERLEQKVSLLQHPHVKECKCHMCANDEWKADKESCITYEEGARLHHIKKELNL